MALNIRRKQIANRNLVNEIPKTRYITIPEGSEKTSDNFYVTLGETITAGDPIYITASKAYKADTVPCIAIALDSGIEDDVILVQYKGIYTFAGSAGADLWNIAGTLSNSPNNNPFWQKLGEMIYDNTCLLNIEEGAWNV
jgi:hypothetical protein